jgi:hypothetical protein
VAAGAAKERRGNKGDDTMSGGDLAAAVKFVKSSQVNTLPKAKSQAKDKRAKDRQ